MSATIGTSAFAWKPERTVLLCLLALIGPFPASQPFPRLERLDSGLRVAVVEDHALPLVSVQLWYGAGSACDPPGKPGLCSVAQAILEHRDDAALRLRAAGVRFESRTERDACYFASVLPPDFVEYVLDIEAQRMRPLPATAEMLAPALNAAALQYADQADDSDLTLLRHVLAAMFPAHPYQYLPGFVAESLKDLSATEVNEFLGRWFVPGNATLFVIGDVSTPTVLEQVRRIFGKLEWAEPQRRAEPTRPAEQTVRLSVQHADRAGVIIAWHTPPLGYFENAAIDVLMEHLCNEVDGPLHRSLGQLGSEPPRWQRHGWRDAGILVLSVDARTASPQALERAITTELTAVLEQIPDEISHNRGRALSGLRARRERATFWGRARLLAEYEVVGGDLLLAQFDAVRARGVSVGDVQAAAGLLNGARRVVVEIQPLESFARSPRAAPLAPSLVANPPARKDVAHLFERVSAISAAAPPLCQPQAIPPVAVGARGHVVTRSCRIATAEQAVVLSVRCSAGAKRGPLVPSSAALDVWIEGAARERWRDYASYHGIDCWPLAGEGAVGIRCGLRPGQVPAGIEWQTRLLQTMKLDGEQDDAALNEVDVIVVGRVAPGDVRQWADECWADWEPPRRAASSQRAAPLAAHPGLRLRWERSQGPGVSLKVSCELPASDVAQAFDDLEVDALAVLLGRVPFGRCRWTSDAVGDWGFWTVRQRELNARADVSAGRFEEVIRRIWERIRLLRRGALPPEQIEAALKLARAERLASLDSECTIADALWLGRANPWSIHEELTSERFIPIVGPALQSAAVRITVYSVEDLAAQVAALEKELNALEE